MTPDEWRRQAPRGEERLDWSTLWSDQRHGGWQVQAATRETDGWVRPNLRLVLGEEDQRLAGAVCVCVRRDGPEPRVLLALQERPAPGIRVWEVPRGMVDPDDAGPAESALRELAEETGTTAGDAHDLGEVYPDTGVFAGSCAVVLATMTGRDEDAQDDDEPEVAATRWCTRAQLDELVVRGELRDGISLAALALARVWEDRQV